MDKEGENMNFMLDPGALDRAMEAERRQAVRDNATLVRSGILERAMARAEKEDQLDRNLLDLLQGSRTPLPPPPARLDSASEYDSDSEYDEGLDGNEVLSDEDLDDDVIDDTDTEEEGSDAEDKEHLPKKKEKASKKKPTKIADTDATADAPAAAPVADAPSPAAVLAEAGDDVGGGGGVLAEGEVSAIVATINRLIEQTRRHNAPRDSESDLKDLLEQLDVADEADENQEHDRLFVPDRRRVSEREIFARALEEILEYVQDNKRKPSILVQASFCSSKDMNVFDGSASDSEWGKSVMAFDRTLRAGVVTLSFPVRYYCCFLNKDMRHCNPIMPSEEEDIFGNLFDVVTKLSVSATHCISLKALLM